MSRCITISEAVDILNLPEYDSLLHPPRMIKTHEILSISSYQVVSSREYAKKHVWRRKKPERKIEDAPTSDQGEEEAFIAYVMHLWFTISIPHICPFWYTTTLFRLAENTPKVRKFATK